MVSITPKPDEVTTCQMRLSANTLTHERSDLAKNWRRRGKFEEVAFVFPNAPSIPITVVRTGFLQLDGIKLYIYFPDLIPADRLSLLSQRANALH